MESSMNKEQVIEAVCKLAAGRVGVEPQTVNLDTDFFQDLSYDSLDVVEFAMEVEDTFDIQVADKEADKFKSVRQVVDSIWPMLS